MTFITASEKSVPKEVVVALFRSHTRKEISAANTAFRSMVNLYVSRAFKSGFILSDSKGILGVSGGSLLQ